MKQIFLLFLILLSTSTYLKSQDSIMYNDDFVLQDGVYKTLDEFKANNPSIKKDVIITDEQLLEVDNYYFKKERLYYKDEEGRSQELSTDSIWGYSYNGAVYVYFKRKFQRLRMFGSITHFLVIQDKLSYDRTVPQSNFNKPYKETPYMFDFLTGGIYKYNLENFQTLLKRDNKLYEEFIALKSENAKQKQMFIYLRKYNENHPVYFRKL